MGEGNPHGRGVPRVLDVAVINDLPTVTRAKLVDGLIESVELVAVGGHGVGDDALEEVGGVVYPLDQAGKCDADLNERSAGFRSILPEALKHANKVEGGACLGE